MSELQCWMRYSGSGKLYRTCDEGGMENRRKDFMREMRSAEKELGELMGKDELDALLLLDRHASPIDKEIINIRNEDKRNADLLLRKFATAIDAEEPSAFSAPVVKKVVPPLEKGLLDLGWGIFYGKRDPTTPFYFNTKTGERMWNRPIDPTNLYVRLQLQAKKNTAKMLRELEEKEKKMDERRRRVLAKVKMDERERQRRR